MVNFQEQGQLEELAGWQGDKVQGGGEGGGEADGESEGVLVE